MACGRNSGFAALQEEAMRIATESGESRRVLRSLAYSTCTADLRFVLERLRMGRRLKKFLRKNLPSEDKG